VPASTQQLAANFNIAAACRPSIACRGFLDTVVRNYTGGLFPKSVTEQCKRKLFVTVTEARPNNLTDPPQVSDVSVCHCSARQHQMPHVCTTELDVMSCG
jgi:hypothetical protein